MPIEGSLREFAVQDIFQLMHLSRKTGELVIVREPSRQAGSVIFDSGAVVRADLGGNVPNLGHLLLNAGKITQADLDRAERVQRENPREGWTDIFAEMGVISSEEMAKYVKFQVEELVLDILDWERGTFSFEERDLVDSEKLTWIPTESLLMEGARRTDELSALPTAIESDDAVPRLCEGAGEGGMLDLTPEEWEVLGRIDGQADIKAISWALSRSEFEVSKVVSRLVDHGLVELGRPEDSRSQPPQDVALDNAEDLIERGELGKAQGRIDSVLHDHPEESRALYLRAFLAERAGELSDALRGYKRTLEVDPLAADARLRLGLVSLRRGDLDRAVDEWTAYLRMSQDSPQKRQLERALAAASELQKSLIELENSNG